MMKIIGKYGAAAVFLFLSAWAGFKRKRGVV